MLLQIPAPVIEEGDNCDPLRSFALSTLFTPSGLKPITPWEKLGPGVA